MSIDVTGTTHHNEVSPAGPVPASENYGLKAARCEQADGVDPTLAPHRVETVESMPDAAQCANVISESHGAQDRPTAPRSGGGKQCRRQERRRQERALVFGANSTDAKSAPHYPSTGTGS